jgi:hypothetical protein
MNVLRSDKVKRRLAILCGKNENLFLSSLTRKQHLHVLFCLSRAKKNFDCLCYFICIFFTELKSSSNLSQRKQTISLSY